MKYHITQKHGVIPVPGVRTQRANVGHALTVETMASPFNGCCNFFDRCSDGDLMSLHFGGTLPLLDWMGFTVSNECLKSFEFLTYVRAARGEGDTASPGHLSNPCDEPNGVSFGTAKLTLEEFGRYGRRGPTREIMKADKYCLTDPRRRLDGTPVTSEKEWDMRFATEVIIQDLSRDLVVGNATTKGKLDGLERWVRTGYSNPILDSIVIDWNGNTMAGGNGITWNGKAIANTFDFVDILRSVIRRQRSRIAMSPALQNNAISPGDMILLMPGHVATCLLDFYTCWSVCSGTNDITVMYQKPEAIAFRNSLNGGLYNAGIITIDGIVIPIMAYDWGLIKSATLSDVYLLIGSVGGVQLWFGEHLNADTAASEFGSQGYFSSDGGRILGAIDTDNECYHLKEWIHPRIYTRAPWLQVRFRDVHCTDAIDPLSPDPESSFYVTNSFADANCPTSFAMSVL